MHECPTSSYLLRLCFLETEVNGQGVTIERIISDISTAEEKIIQLEINTAGITRNIYCPTKYPGQEITQISDTLQNGDAIVNCIIKNTFLAGNLGLD